MQNDLKLNLVNINVYAKFCQISSRINTEDIEKKYYSDITLVKGHDCNELTQFEK